MKDPFLPGQSRDFLRNNEEATVTQGDVTQGAPIVQAVSGT
jgi:hypothetical protein